MKIFSKNDTGAAAIEFALLAPAVIMILFGIINYGVLMFNQSVITNAAREGARWAAIHTTKTYGTGCSATYSASPVDPCQAAYSYAYNSLITFDTSANINLNIAATTTDANYAIGSAQTIKVIYSFKSIGWYLGVDPTGNYTSTAVMLHE